MSMPTINADAIVEILQSAVSHLGPVEYTASFRSDLELDSLDLSLFFLNVQEAYGVEITDGQAIKLDSITDIVVWLQSQ